jgi:hypothetical protein
MRFDWRIPGEAHYARVYDADTGAEIIDYIFWIDEVACEYCRGIPDDEGHLQCANGEYLSEIVRRRLVVHWNSGEPPPPDHPGWVPSETWHDRPPLF